MSLLEIADESALEEVLQLPRVLLAKHSTKCFISTRAMRQVNKFAEKHSEIPVYQLDILAHPDLSERVASELQVPHESPQIILLSNGEAIWNDSHFGITQKAIEKAVEG